MKMLYTMAPKQKILIRQFVLWEFFQKGYSKRSLLSTFSSWLQLLLSQMSLSKLFKNALEAPLILNPPRRSSLCSLIFSLEDFHKCVTQKLNISNQPRGTEITHPDSVASTLVFVSDDFQQWSKPLTSESNCTECFFLLRWQDEECSLQTTL